MTTYFDACDIGPVPAPGPGAVAPEPFRGIYGMPAFMTLPTANLAESVDFWERGLGFINLFTIPDRLTHLRRWAFQDALLVPGEIPARPPAISLSFACMRDQSERIARNCERVRPGSVSGPRHTPWNSVELEIITPENARIIMTAAKELDPAGPEARSLGEMGITVPGA